LEICPAMMQLHTTRPVLTVELVCKQFALVTCNIFVDCLL